MTIDQGWSMQAVTALDLSALSASESIVNSSQDTNRGQSTVHDEVLGGTHVPDDVTELTNGKIYDSEGPGMPLHVSATSDYQSGMMRPVAATVEGSPQEQVSAYFGATQLDQAYSANLAASVYMDQQQVGRIVDYTA